MEESSLKRNISDDSLQLVITEKTLGKLITNAQQIHDMVKKSLPKYDVKNYNDDNIEQAKSDKAALNKAAKALNDKRIELEGEFNKPFAEFKSVISDTVTLIKQCSSKIDEVVKQTDNKRMEKKKTDIQVLYKSLNPPVELNKIWDDRWLNKTVTMHKVDEEINKKIEEIRTNLAYLKNLANDKDDVYESLKAQFLVTLNLNSTLDYFNQLKKQREAEEERKKAEAELAAHKYTIHEVFPEVTEPVNQDIPFGDTESVKNGTEHVNSGTENVSTVSHQVENDEILTRYFTVTCSKSKLIALSDYLNDNDIDFDKLDICDTECKTNKKLIVASLEYANKFITSNSKKTSDLERARTMLNISKRLSISSNK